MPSVSQQSIYNVPNTLTGIRFLMALAVLVLIPLDCYLAANVVFLIAVSTDWMDGYWARKYNQVTKFGRIFDPFVDKIIICGTFIALTGVAESCVYSWMATIVVARELLVTSLRGMVEGSGGDFSARWLGKWKMVLQCAAVVAALWLLESPEERGLLWTARILVWSSIALTIYSGYDYCVEATKILSKPTNAES